MPELVYGLVPHPKYIKRIVPKPYENAGFDRVKARKIVGTCEHRTYGLGTVEGIYRLFATGGERQYDALTDYVIGLDGTIMMLNEPTGTRSPWANGGSDGLEGDGPLFVRTFGVSGINGNLVSIENIGMPETPFEDEQFESCAQLMAHWHDKARIPWDKFPLNPAYGCVTDLQHFEFATKDCPFGAFKAKTVALQDRVRAIMKKAQSGAANPTEPAPGPVTPDHAKYPKGMNKEKATKYFGTLTRHNLDGTTSTTGFNEKGVIQNAWLERGGKENVYPEADDWYVVQSSGGRRQLITFKNGWAMMKGNDREAFKWI